MVLRLTLMHSRKLSQDLIWVACVLESADSVNRVLTSLQ